MSKEKLIGLIKGSKKEEAAEGHPLHSSVASNRKKVPFLNKRELWRSEESDPRLSLIKKGKMMHEPVVLFESDTFSGAAGNLGSTKESEDEILFLSNPEEALINLKETAQDTLTHARTESERILADAQVKAKKLIEQSKLYCQTAKANAEREGIAEGKLKAREEALAELKGIMEKARDTLRQTQELHHSLAQKMEGGLAKLALKIAEKVIAREVSLDGDVVIAMVRSQLEKMKDRDQVIIHVHPDDLAKVKEKKEVFLKAAPHVKTVEIEPDGRVGRGSCMIETNLGTVDASISTQLEAIELAFSKKAESVPQEKPENLNHDGN